MDIKIRSQSGAKLVDCTNKDIILGGNLKLLNEVVVKRTDGSIETIGRYKTMEEAVEVIDIIEATIRYGYSKNLSGIIYTMPESKGEEEKDEKREQGKGEEGNSI